MPAAAPANNPPANNAPAAPAAAPPPWQVTDFVAQQIPRNDIGLRQRDEGWLPGGHFKTKIANFSGGTNVGTQGFALYGVDGVNPPWVYDGTSVRFIETGRGLSGQDDNPNSLAVLPTQQLALGYQDGMLTLSSIGEPTTFEVSKGAAEIAVSDEIVELATQPNEVLAIFCKATLKMLVGKLQEQMQLTTYSEKLGMTPFTHQPLGDSIFLTDDGITRLNRVQEFGDFRDLSLSAKIKPLMDKLHRHALCSWVVATRNEYWLQYNEKIGVIVKFLGAEVAGISTFSYGVRFTAATSEEFEGEEIVLAGAEDGYVYRLERGHSFDGRPIPAYFNSAYEFLGSVEHRKRIKKVQVELDTEEVAELKIRAEIDYSSPEAPADFMHQEFIRGGGGFYDLDLFNTILWSESDIGLTDTYVSGVGRNVSVATYSLSDREPPHVLGSLLVHWSQRGRRA